MPPHYEFDEGFQKKIAALVLRDFTFGRRTQGLIRPDYFDDISVATVANLGLEYFEKYSKTPSPPILIKMLKEGIADKSIAEDLPVSELLKEIYKEDISDRDYVIDEIAKFAKHQALSQAILDAADIMETKDFDKISSILNEAMRVGANSEVTSHDYIADLEKRSKRRLDIVSGKIKKDGITTGIYDFDKELYHHGWGRRELSVLMGAAKSGKTTALISFGLNALLNGLNVFYVSMEVSSEIIMDRMDANLAEIPMMKIDKSVKSIEAKIGSLSDKIGTLKIEDFPTGSLSPSDLRRRIAWHEGQGVRFDLIVVDYADIMAPDRWMNDERSNLKQIYIDLRAIACERTAPDDGFPAVLTATQTNREGAKSTVAKMTDVAEDFNKIRTADLVISINATEEEISMGEARLYFAAARNSASNFSIRIKQNRECMRFLERIIGKE